MSQSLKSSRSAQPSKAAPAPAIAQFAQQLFAIEGASASDPITSGEELLDLTLDLLDRGDFQARWELAKLLPQLVSAQVVAPQTAIDSLLDLLQDEDTEEELAWFAVRILGQIDHADVLMTLLEALKAAESEELRAMAAEAIAAQGSKAIAPLADLIREPEWRLLAVQALSQIRHSATIAPLLEVVQDDDSQIRSATVEALSSFHDARIPPVLLDALGDRSAAVRREAAIGLGFHPQLADAIVPRLQTCLYDFNLEVCRQATIALGRINTPAAAEALFELLRSPHTPVPLQVETVRALSWMNAEAAIDALQQRLTASTGDVTQEILVALGRIETDDLKPKAAKILSNSIATLPTPELKQTAALSLGQLGQADSIELLLNLLVDADVDADVGVGVRLHAIAALRQIDAADQQLKTLATAENLSDAVRQGVAIALAEW